ncbi:MAG: RNA methyltransferase [Proteobacteria bacterium]|nr:RNA methyltransferase [Pseudomonadota bacterium]
MAGTGQTRHLPEAPAVVLVGPQLGENIGMVARAMLNCGLGDLRLVRPRDGWPSESAAAAAAGATAVIDGVRLFEATNEAVADLQLLFAATARPRHMTKKTTTPRRAAADMRAFAARGGRAGVLLGPESRGLSNDDVALADALITIPLNPDFQSLNLAMAVLLVGYEWYLAGADDPGPALAMPKRSRPATKDEMGGLFEHLERELDACGFLRNEEKRPVTVRNLRNIFQRAGLTDQEVRTLRGVIAGLASGRGD